MFENLELIRGEGRHNKLINQRLKQQTEQIQELQSRVTLLEAENVLLRSSLTLEINL